MHHVVRAIRARLGKTVDNVGWCAWFWLVIGGPSFTDLLRGKSSGQPALFLNHR